MSDQFLQHLVAFAEAGNQQKIQLEQVTHQGWVMEITEDGLVMSTGYNEKVGKDVSISMDELKHAKLFFWDTKTNIWQAFVSSHDKY
ncbi:hypothetical protein I2F27_01160 [Acinetobacter sp. B5B]|uniref:hypothetical protein n=1 Tax=Acinetobacter baretiae TaxID=2605383 RepID=UPI0018C1E98C|nr:hypothetical protein [Acinetobacter baretiae]MBF7681948.1 hypothetical protein [Acinetobacter baretiae]MBF7685680.1 hypothetical protein [Acinetobacter baretiae]